MAERSGIVYMRTTRGAYPVLYGPDEEFPVGGAKVVRSSPEDQVTLIGAGVTLHNCLAAAGELGGEGIRARVVDLYSVKPIDVRTLLAAADATAGSETTRPPAAAPRSRAAPYSPTPARLYVPHPHLLARHADAIKRSPRFLAGHSRPAR